MWLGVGEGYQEASFSISVASAPLCGMDHRATCESKEGVFVGYKSLVTGDARAVLDLE